MNIVLPENITGHWLWSDPQKFQWWIMLLQQVATKPCVAEIRGKRIKVGYGELVTTQGELAKLWKTTTATAQAFLRKLESNGLIRRKVDARLTQLSICNCG